MKKKLVILTGAGISQESGIQTFRDLKGGLWYDYDPMEVASIAGWRKDREKVIDFYNKRRRDLPNVQPNYGHIGLVELEKDFDVTIITQNVDDLHERAGSTNIIHLHGELTKARSCMYDTKDSPLDQIIDIGYNDINIGDKCPTTGSQLRPHIVWFGESVPMIQEAIKIVAEADIFVVIGTSLSVYPAASLLYKTKTGSLIYIIDPEGFKPSYKDIDHLVVSDKIVQIKEKASEGVRILIEKLKQNDN